MKKGYSVRKIIIPLLQFVIYVLLAEATTGKKQHNRPIKAIITNQLFKVK
jgi:hypothetical protein